jgi:ribosomal protein L31E
MAREQQVNVRVRPKSVAIDESVDLAHEIYNRVFRKVPEKLK